MRDYQFAFSVKNVEAEYLFIGSRLLRNRLNVISLPHKVCKRTNESIVVFFIYIVLCKYLRHDELYSKPI